MNEKIQGFYRHIFFCSKNGKNWVIIEAKYSNK